MRHCVHRFLDNSLASLLKPLQDKTSLQIHLSLRKCKLNKQNKMLVTKINKDNKEKQTKTKIVVEYREREFRSQTLERTMDETG